MNDIDIFMAAEHRRELIEDADRIKRATLLKKPGGKKQWRYSPYFLFPYFRTR